VGFLPDRGPLMTLWAGTGRIWGQFRGIGKAAADWCIEFYIEFAAWSLKFMQEREPSRSPVGEDQPLVGIKVISDVR